MLDCKSENWAPVTGLPLLANTVRGQDLGFLVLPLLVMKGAMRVTLTSQDYGGD